MAKIRDRTEDFKDAVRAAALSLDYSELQKDNVDLHRSTAQGRDNVEHEVSFFVKACKDQIDILKNRILEEEKDGDSTRWLSLRVDCSRADVVAHKHGIFDRLGSIRFQDAVNKAVPRRKVNRVVPDSKSSEASKSDLEEFGDLELPSSSGSVQVQDQLLDDDTCVLQVELMSLLDAVQETETMMVEMSALNHLMSTHVLQQAQQIEHLYDQAVEATKNVELGNKELAQAIKRNSSRLAAEHFFSCSYLFLHFPFSFLTGIADRKDDSLPLYRSLLVIRLTRE